MIKICIDARGINLYSGTGIGTYTKNVLNNLLSIDYVNNYSLLWCNGNYEQVKKKNTKIIVTGDKNSSYWSKIYIPEILNNSDFDIFHIPQNGIDMPEIKTATKIVTTIHDLIPYTMPETVGKGYKDKFLSQMPNIIKKSDAIITVSEFSKMDILKYFDYDPSKIFVTHLATNKIFKPMNINYCKAIVKERCGIVDDFILYLGGFSDRKNIKGLIKAYAAAKKDFIKYTKLLIIGNPREQQDSISSLISQLHIENDVVFAGFVKEDELPIFYNAAIAFVYPSFYEGFGLPPLEAMSCGTPVITSNLTSIPEIVGDAAMLINPHNINGLRDSLIKLLSEPKIYDVLVNKGLKRASEFSWLKTAKETLNVYETISMNK